jgi:abhydrolase domain-containing protein 17
LLLKYAKGSSKIFLYFHANAEDLGRAYKFLNYVNVYLRMHVMAVEYPGYGIYEGDNPNADKIINDADIVYKFLLKNLNWKEHDIIICGRSIGSGPGCYLASTYKPCSLVLISPHTSIRGIVKDQYFGKLT